MQFLDPSFEYVHPSGTIMNRAAFVDWFATQGYGCHSGSAAAAAAADPTTGGGGDAASSGRHCMWLDRYSERQLAPGVWLARYLEQHQPFAGVWCLLCFACKRMRVLLCMCAALGCQCDSCCLPSLLRFSSPASWCLPACLPAVAGKHTGEKRVSRWASVILLQQTKPEAGAYRVAYIHESLVPVEQARA